MRIFLGVMSNSNTVVLDGSAVPLSYDGYGRLSGKKANGTQTAAFAYDALGRLSRVKDLTNGHTTLYEYDIAGRLTRQLNGQGSFRYQYDNMNRLTRQSVTAPPIPPAMNTLRPTVPA